MAESDTDAKSKQSSQGSCIDIISNYLIKSLRLKSHVWPKCYNTEEYKEVIIGFLKESYQERLIFTLNAAGMLTASHEFPEKTKNKIVYFVRRNMPTTITVENFFRVLLIGDLLPNIIDSLSSLLDNVFYPMLSNPDNQTGWTSVIVNEMKSETQNLRNAIVEIKGAMINKTILPMPIAIDEIMKIAPKIAKGDLSGFYFDLKHSIESIVINWEQVVRAHVEHIPNTINSENDTYDGPQKLFDTWNSRLENLEFIKEQLTDSKVKTVGFILEKVDSVYLRRFRQMNEIALENLLEARDITLYLLPLKKIIDKLDTLDFDECKPLITPLLLNVCLLWTNSLYFPTRENMSLLFRMINNTLIDNSLKSLDPDSIFQGELEESYLKLKPHIEILQHYKKTYEYLKSRLDSFKKVPNSTAQDWSWNPDLIFSRVDLYLNRLEMLQQAFMTGIEFVRLEKVEIGGIKGRLISAEMQKISEDSTNFYRGLSNIKINPLDITADINETEKEMLWIKEEIDTLERRVANQFERAFQDCHELNSTIQLIHIGASLLHRELIKPQVIDYILNVAVLFDQELDAVKIIFDEFNSIYKQHGVEGLPVDPYYPKVSGAIQWARKLKDRILTPQNDFHLLEFPIFQSEFGQYTLDKMNEMLGHLQKFERTIYDKWVRRVTRQITDGMNKPLLRKENDQLLLNFDIELDTALKDIKNLNYLDYEHTELINKFFEKESYLWDARLKLTRIAEWYNDMHNNIHKSEFVLIKKEIEAIDNLLKSSLETVNWNNFKKSNIEKEYKIVNNLHTRLVLTHNHLQAIRDSIRSWGKIPLYDRKDNQAKALFNTDDRIKILENRFQQCLETINLIAKAMKANLKLFFNLQLTLDDFFPDEEIPIWILEVAKKEDVKVTENININNFTFNSKFDNIDPDMISIKSLLEDPIYSGLTPNDRITFHEYQKYVDEVIAEELRTVVIFNIRHILEEIDYRCEKNSPIFEIKMELQEPKIIFIKDIDINSPDGFFIFIIMLLNDILNITIMIPKVCQPFSPESTFPIITKHEETFHKSIEKDPEIIRLRHDIVKRTKSALAMIVQHVRQYNEHNYIWTDNKDEYLAEIKKYGRPLTLGERELDPHNFKVKEQEPTLDIYREQLDKFLELYTEVSEWESFEDFYFWLRLNKKGFKHSVLNQLVRWVNLFRQDLVNRVTNDLDELENFIVEAINVLSTEVDKEDFEGILKIMMMLNKINDRQFKYDFMFEPLKDITELLKVYNYEFSDKVATQFSELPDAWNKVKRQAAATKQLIAPMQAYQVDLIERRIILLDVRMNIFRNKFLDQPFFKAPCDFVYEKLDNMNKELLLLEESYEHLKESAQLFDIPEPDQTKPKRTRREIKMVKELWDFVLAIDSTVDDWKKTLWKRIDIDEIDQECKKFGRELRLLDKDMRSWDPYIHGESILKKLMTSLRAVNELQNPAIRDRHWAELMYKTNVQFRMDDSTTLEDLLALNLHNYEEEVKDIVDKSVKEMAMEKLIHDITHAWKNMEFTTDIHERTGLKLLKISEETIEQLEDHQVQLQNMLSSKYIEHFFDEVTDWQKKLSNADAMITAWFEVQRKWQYLESIFIGSVDIRSQLPEDSKRFDSIDKEFKSMLAQVNADRNIIHATNKPGIVENLEHLANELVLCEKALNDYLETKRLAYPRFYFVSSTDLLDILSHGNKPLLVCKHLTKLYDSLAKLVLIEGTKHAKGMIAKEHDEYVPFNNICDCSGPVEVWLNRVTDKMRETLRDHFRRAVEAYEENPRHVWIFEWPAQPALVTTQIWWTADTNLAFKKLEMGYENAMKDFNKKQISQLNALINLLLGDLSKGDRQKIMTVCTIDVHSRDVVIKLIAQKIEQVNAFQWQSQLRHRWDKDYDDCFANICDAQFRYDYEYLGNTPRLVITPLTDRCYITLTQSLHLVMGGAPAGPAGTGKTETTKDLGRALGMMVYVFNCSEQMDYKSTGNIHKGLAQTGAWGCFDEFNRISVDVLSVVAVQVKSILDAIKSKKEIFNFLGEYIKLRPTVGMFITMNPGYAGRTELPENLKTLYRPCAMVVPDFAMICEIMLVAEGFQDAKLLARKFITLYTLCKELLSKQDHYDWGLRAIKSVLVVAGALRRGDRDRPEDQVLMRALRDFNIPKIVTDDVPVFMGLIGDLFPALDVPRKRDMEFEDMIKKTAIEMKLQPEDGFILKVVQLEELFAVRHSVFIIGNAGTGKSEVWKTLHRTYQNMKKKPFYNDLNPKAVTNDELFGIVNPATREWKDGLFSIIMRDQANMGGDGPKWIVLDGDIDPMWIESLNTVMDDNKVLTLASNERIALTKEMRLLFEIANLKTATPATVSRAGILYINPQDLGWNPYVASWIGTRSNESEKSNLLVLFERYIPSLLEVFRTKLKRITPISEIAMIQMTCYLLDVFLTPSNVPPECPREWYEIYFVFAVIWGFGSTLFQDQILDWRNEFSKWWVNEFKSIKFPSGGNLFSFYVDHETKKFLPWKNLVKSFELNPDIPLQASLVPTDETTRLLYFMDILIKRGYPVMLVGPPGSGKSVIMNSKLNLLPDSYAVTNVPFNFYTTSEMLQRVLEKPLEKKAGRNYGPIGNKSMIYFVDDLNMPEVDLYGTVQPHTLIRQFMDYKHWYDRQKMTLREIHKCQFVSCMNPSAGSFTINPRLQRHFCTFAVNAPSTDALFHILSSILQQHLDFPHNKFSKPTKSICESLVNSAIALHQKISSTFLPTAIKFHYNFNLRDISNIFTGIMFANGDCCPNPDALIRLWIHECTRVYGDKLVSYDDLADFDKTIKETVKKEFATFNEDVVFKKPTIFCHFANGLVDPKYMPADNWEVLSKLLNEAQDGYNDLIGAMNLVLFEDAMAHVCRINRILEAPRGYALLIGVGGSGKQSLTRLACFISSLDVFQIQLSRGYGINDMKADLSNLYLKAGIKHNSNCFLLTDSEVAQEEFLVLVNDMLASGEIPELFPDEEIDNIIGGIRNEVKQQGIFDNKENCWKYFIEKVRGMLKIVLCFSPVGSTLRVRARKFPAIINCTTIDWFHEWPKQALESVSQRFLSQIEVLPVALVKPISEFMAFVHGSVNDISQDYLLNDKRYNYTTPKSFLELISLYGKLLTEKVEAGKDRVQKLENGLLKLASCALQVDGLQEVLKEQEVVLKVKNEAADKLIVVVSAENEKVQAERNIAEEEEEKVRAIEEDVSARAAVCEEDLRRAQPLLIAAQEALQTLNKNNLTELKSFGSPPQAVVNVCAAVLVLFSKKGKIPKDRSWKACKILMGKVDQFLHELTNYDKENIPPDVIKALLPYLNDPEFDPDNIRAKSIAAAGLCAWVINIHKFYEVYLVVEPKVRALKNAQDELKAAREKLIFLNNKLNELQAKLNVIQAEYDAAMAEKQKCQDEADKTAFTLDLANRLINGLASEKVRWRESINSIEAGRVQLPGDILLVSCFISYVGCFSRPYRIELMQKLWLPHFKNMEPSIPSTEGADPFHMICDDAQIAEWNNQGLPSDRMSAENAAILTICERYPLMIDPQLQGIRWIKKKYGRQLIVLRLMQKNYLDVIEKAVRRGSTLLLENIEETIDAVLNPLLSRTLIKKGTILKIGDKEIDFNPKFRLILQTKLANPHYKPEMQAQLTLINFTVTRGGLEEQLLARVVKKERLDLEMMRTKLTQQQNTFKITLKQLEDDLLQRLSTAGENVLDDPTLVLNLEKTKKTAEEIEIRAKEAKLTSAEIDEARENYRPAAKRASIIYFILNDLFKVNPIYQFSLKAYTVVFSNAMAKADEAENLRDRIENLIDSITFCSFVYTSRGLFEQDKLIFLFQMTIQILLNAGEMEQSELDFLLKFPYVPGLTSPVPFLTNVSWGGIKALCEFAAFKGFDKDVEMSHKRWESIVQAECPEKEKFPSEWKNKTDLQKLCMMRALRPDRMVYAVQRFIEAKFGTKYIETRTPLFSKTFEETDSNTHVFFILSPGVDPLKDVEKLGRQMGFHGDNDNFHNVSLGQGQEVVAERAMDIASAEGHWVILQNIHLVAKWLSTLEKKIESTQEHAHKDYRLFLSAEPAAEPSAHILPQGILESAIKITNEPPTGMLANIHKALDNFSQETLEQCSKETEFKSILFALCYFHAVVAERRKFGPQGWNRVYPFNFGDLTISVYVLHNYLEANVRVPWEDLRYLFGDIMYGGHITDDWDRRLCRTYLEVFMQPELIDAELFFCPGFQAPENLDYIGYHQYVDDKLPTENPNLYGLHLNAEIGFLSTLSERLFKTVLILQPRSAGGSKGTDMSQEDVVRTIIEETLDKVPSPFNIPELMARTEDRSPYTIVAFQECERMNLLMGEIRRSLQELELGLKGELTITSDMEDLMNMLFMDKVPDKWTKLAYPSLLGLQSWIADLMNRLHELENWVQDFRLPSSVWLGMFFNPQSFLTAIMQQTARKNGWPLDRMCLNCDVTKRMKEDITTPPREGAYVNGLFMEGARWDSKMGTIADAFIKDLYPMMPVIYIKAVTQDKQDVRNVYECPVYKIRMRGPTYVWTFNLKTKEKPSKWTLAGVCLLLQP